MYYYFYMLFVDLLFTYLLHKLKFETYCLLYNMTVQYLLCILFIEQHNVLKLYKNECCRNELFQHQDAISS